MLLWSKCYPGRRVVLWSLQGLTSSMPESLRSSLIFLFIISSPTMMSPFSISFVLCAGSRMGQWRWFEERRIGYIFSVLSTSPFFTSCLPLFSEIWTPFSSQLSPWNQVRIPWLWRESVFCRKVFSSKVGSLYLSFTFSTHLEGKSYVVYCVIIRKGLQFSVRRGSIISSSFLLLAHPLSHALSVPPLSQLTKVPVALVFMSPVGKRSDTASLCARKRRRDSG